MGGWMCWIPNGDIRSESCYWLHAGSCGNDEYLCPERWCIPMTWRCNGIAECANGEDEKLCGKSLSLFLCSFVPLLKFLLYSLHFHYWMVLCVIKSLRIIRLSMCTDIFLTLYVHVSWFLFVLCYFTSRCLLNTHLVYVHEILCCVSINLCPTLSLTMRL